jgi:hypothetical protein
MRLLILSALLACTQLQAEEEKSHDILVQIQLTCPECPELANFTKSIPEAGHNPASYEEWKESFVTNMTRLIELVQSDNVYNASWGASSQEHIEQE